MVWSLQHLGAACSNKLFQRLLQGNPSITRHEMLLQSMDGTLAVILLAQARPTLLDSVDVLMAAR